MIAQDMVLNFCDGGEDKMTDMRRITIALPDSIDRKILELKKEDRFLRCSYAEVVRWVLEHGLEIEAERG
jgi:hypothetical protein